MNERDCLQWMEFFMFLAVEVAQQWREPRRGRSAANLIEFALNKQRKFAGNNFIFELRDSRLVQQWNYDDDASCSSSIKWKTRSSVCLIEQ